MNKDVKFSSTVDIQIPSPSVPIDEQIYPAILLEAERTAPLELDVSNVNIASGSQMEGWMEDMLQGFSLSEFDEKFFDDEFFDALGAVPPQEQVESEEYEDEVPEEIQQPAGVVRSCDTMPSANFFSNAEFLYFVETLRLLVQPHLFQRARYEKELKKDLRYIAVPDDGTITMGIPDNLPPGASLYMRITRTTMPHGPNNIMYCHPYPLWLKDPRAIVHHGSLYVPIDQQARVNQQIKFEHLIMQRLKQSPLKRIRLWPIFKHDQLDCNDFHLIDTTSAKSVIGEYDLRHSILHFQVVLVDEDQVAHATDIQCQTESIYEYEGKELKKLPENAALPSKRVTKRLQSKPKPASTKKDRATVTGAKGA